jgi:hypothetical protein
MKVRVVDLDLTVFAFISNYTNGKDFQGVENLPVFEDAVNQIKEWINMGDNVLFCSRSKHYDLCRRVLLLHGILLDQKYIKYTNPSTKIPHFRALHNDNVDLKQAILYDDDEAIIAEATKLGWFKGCVLVDPQKGLSGKSINKRSLENIQRAAKQSGYILSAVDKHQARLMFSKL